MSFPRMHVSLYVKNIYQTADFYSKFFGQNPDKIKSDYCKFTLDEPSLIISFVQNEEKVSDQFGHLGFQIESLEELKQRMDEMNLQNITVLEEMGTNCCYANQDKFWVTDPNGYMWEVYYFHEDVEFNDPRYAT
ncbi:MAG: ArsI/CadI family heavy metal resistance metalloenzyme, partial [Flavobacteriales bacterium]|nr:ArsI/CadI family heavy metal resistance metalloenzyme [Flavobacteriales bacterium]